MVKKRITKTQSKKKINQKHFRVAIFGSARIKRDDPRYKLVKRLAKMISEEGMDIVTGGGPGLMDAASRGHHQGDKNSEKTESIGLTITLPHEQRDAYHLDIKRDFTKFSNRLDTFMKLSDVVVVAPGGVGTLLELLYTWQLIQVKQICHIPVILLGKHWQGLLDWIRDNMAKKKLMSMQDFQGIVVVNNSRDAMKIIKDVHDDYKNGGHLCRNFDTY